MQSCGSLLKKNVSPFLRKLSPVLQAQKYAKRSPSRLEKPFLSENFGKPTLQDTTFKMRVKIYVSIPYKPICIEV